MYELFYKFRKSPFSLSPDPDFLYLSLKHKNALAVLEHSLTNWVGLSAITGEKGTGKSTLIRYLLKQSWPDVTFGLVSESDTPSGGLLKRTLSAFGLNSFGKTTTESYDLLSDFMVIDCFWKKRQPVLIIDESLGMESKALEELYMLSTMELEDNRNLRIVLAMPPSSWETLKRPKWAHLAGRVGNHYQLDALNYQETVAYVQHRLRVAGAQNDNLFDNSAYKAIFRYSGGNPRLINVLCNATLVQGAIQETPQIGAALIKNLIMQKLWLRAASTDPQGEAHGRPETGANNVDQAAGNQSDTDDLRPAFGRLSKRDKTGQTVSEFIIADIDQASRKYARLDAEVTKPSDKIEPTGETHQGTVKRFRRMVSIAVVLLITAAVAIIFGWDRSSRESQWVQRDQDAQRPRLINALRPSDESRRNLDLPDLQVQRVSEVDNLLMEAQQKFDLQQLTQPAGDNAWETYQKVLQLDPINQPAKEGLQRIVERIESKARDKRQNGNFPASLSIIEEGLRVLPNYLDLLTLKEEINRQIEAQRSAQQVEGQSAPTDDEEATPEPKTKKEPSG